MKKIAFVAGVVVATGGAYAVNSYLVNKAVQEVPLHIQKMIDSADKSVVDIETLSSKSSGKHLTQEFALYAVENGVRSETPLYITHDLDIGFFALNAKGSISLPKDKGFAQQFVEEATTFSESINYTYALASQEVDLISSISFDPVENEQGERVEFGTLRFNVKGNEETNSGDLTLDSFQFTGSGTDVISADNIKLVFDNTTTHRESEFSLDKLKFSNIHSYTQNETRFDVQDVKLISEVTLDDKQEYASVVNNWNVNAFSMKASNFELPTSKLGFTAKIDGINIKELNSINEALAAQDEEKLLQLSCSFLEKGLKMSDIKVYINNSDVTGFIDLAPADYSAALSPYQAGFIAGQNIKSDLDIKMAKKDFETFNIPVEMVAPLLTQQYKFTEDENKFIGQVKIANGHTTINNVALR